MHLAHILAASLAIEAAWWMLTWERQIERSREWLNSRFGPSRDHDEIARAGTRHVLTAILFLAVFLASA